MPETANNDDRAAALDETTAMIVWPSIGATRLGRWVGRLCANKTGFAGFFTLGKLLALATIPISLAIFFWQLLPVVARRYRLTDRRLVIQKGLRPVDEKSIDLDAFDTVHLDMLPGQKWLRCGDVVFRREGDEVFRLCGVPNPEPFRRSCLGVQSSLRSVREVLQQQTAGTEQPAAS